MGKFITYVGLDVHKKTIAVAFADEGGVEVRSYGTINSDLSSLDKVQENWCLAAVNLVLSMRLVPVAIRSIAT